MRTEEGRYLPTRDREAKLLLRGIGVGAAKALSNLLLLGSKKVGKSWFLQNLAESKASDREKGSDWRFVFVYLDLGAQASIEDLRQSLVHQIEQKANEPVGVSGNRIPTIIGEANQSKVIPILLYDHLERAVEMDRLHIDDYFEAFCEGIPEPLQFAWVLTGTATDKSSYLSKLRGKTQPVGAAVSGILDRSIEEFRLQQLHREDVDRLLNDEAAKLGIPSNPQLNEELYKELGGCPLLLLTAIRMVARQKASWQTIRTSFREQMRRQIVDYLFEGDAALAFRKSLHGFVDSKNRKVERSHLPVLVNSGLCPPDDDVFPQLLLEIAESAGTAGGYYYALVIDHESLWLSIRDWFRKYRPNEFTEALDHVYHDTPGAFRAFNKSLMTHVADAIKSACRTRLKINDFDTMVAVADWRNFSYEDKDAYLNARIKTNEPDLAGNYKGKTDAKIYSLLSEDIRQTAHHQGKRLMTVMVSCDGGYGQILEDFHKLGDEYCYVFFKSLRTRPFLNQLDAQHSMSLEPALALDRFRPR